MIAYDKLPEELQVKTKIRFSKNASDSIVRPHGDGVIVEFNQPQRAITKGQAVVFYKEDLVVGGGIIKEVFE